VEKRLKTTVVMAMVSDQNSLARAMVLKHDIMCDMFNQPGNANRSNSNLTSVTSDRYKLTIHTFK